MPASSFSKGEESTVSEGGTRRTFFKRSSTKTALERQESGTAEVKKAVFHVHIHGGMVGGLACGPQLEEAARQAAEASNRRAVTNEYYRQNPSEPAVDLGLLHVAVNDREVNLDLQESAASFVVLQPGKEPEPVKVVLTLPLISSEARDSLEAAAAAGRSFARRGRARSGDRRPSTGKGFDAAAAGFARRRSSSGLAPASTSSRDEETSAEDEALRRKRSLTRRRSFDVNMEELAELCPSSQRRWSASATTRTARAARDGDKDGPNQCGLGAKSLPRARHGEEGLSERNRYRDVDPSLWRIARQRAPSMRCDRPQEVAGR